MNDAAHFISPLLANVTHGPLKLESLDVRVVGTNNWSGVGNFVYNSFSPCAGPHITFLSLDGFNVSLSASPFLQLRELALHYTAHPYVLPIEDLSVLLAEAPNLTSFTFTFLHDHPDFDNDDLDIDPEAYLCSYSLTRITLRFRLCNVAEQFMLRCLLPNLKELRLTVDDDATTSQLDACLTAGDFNTARLTHLAINGFHGVDEKDSWPLARVPHLRWLHMDSYGVVQDMLNNLSDCQTAVLCPALLTLSLRDVHASAGSTIMELRSQRTVPLIEYFIESIDPSRSPSQSTWTDRVD